MTETLVRTQRELWQELDNEIKRFAGQLRSNPIAAKAEGKRMTALESKRFVDCTSLALQLRKIAELLESHSPARGAGDYDCMVYDCMVCNAKKKLLALADEIEGRK